ncbi:MAG: sigma-70 family RNA polymerase sigma factor [Alphaproteobacteria bacterium]|nr:sigma-70 family RNA polymerase sigma factor [Alphaproteobacteria bacterium]MCB9695744.1 sigma-70 family RNA polymerase sigma factor [Alphaproteobacteria bacterium]
MSESLPELDEETYATLRRVAGRIAGGHQTLQPTALLHEAWVKLERSDLRYESRAHFLAVASKAMRQILVNHAVARRADKRGGGRLHTTLGDVGGWSEEIDVLEVDEALRRLEATEPEAARVVLLRVFGGMTIEEVAEVLDTSPRSVSRTWRFARAWLKKAVEG